MSRKDLSKVACQIKLNKMKSIVDGGCWISHHKPRENGYVRISFSRKVWYLHRLSYFVFNGELIDGKDVCHKCDVRNCFNPSHLFQGSRKDNMQDAVSKGRQATGMSLPQSKLTTEDKGCIIHLINKGLLYKDIAPLFGVTRHSIGQVAIKHGIRRKAA